MGILRHGLKTLLRNKGRTMGITVVVVIAIALFSGINIAAASLTSYNVQNSLEGTLVDIGVSASVDDPTSSLSILAGIQVEYPVIQDIFPMAVKSYNSKMVLNSSGDIAWAEINASGYDFNYFERQGSLIGIDQSALEIPRLAGIIDISAGTFPVDNHSIMLDNKTATRLNVNVGSNLSIGAYTTVTLFGYGGSEYQLNYTQDISNLTLTGIFSVPNYKKLNTLMTTINYYPYLWSSQGAIIWANFTSMRSILDRLTPDVTGISPWDLPTTFFGVIINHGVVSALDVMGSAEQIAQISNAIYSQGWSNGFTTTDNLYTTIKSEESYITALQMVLLLVAIPPLFIGVFLALTLSNQTFERRIPEIGQLKSKGATNRQISVWFFGESSLIGLVGGILGYIAGFGTCFLFLIAELGPNFPEFLAMNLVHSNWESFIFALLFGIGICTGGVIGPIRRLRKTAIVDETKRYINAQTYKAWKSRFDIPALITGSFPIIWTLIFSPQIIRTFPTELQSITMVIGQYMTGASLLAPFLLTYGLIKVVAGRSPKRFSRIAQWVAKAVSPKSAWLIGRNVGGRPKQSGGLVFILAISISMGILMATLKASEEKYERNLVYGVIGADVKVWLPNSFGNVSYDFQDTLLHASADIAQVTPGFVTLNAEARGSPMHAEGTPALTTQIAVCGINASEYCSVVDFDPAFLPYGDPTSTFAKLASVPNGTLLLYSWATANGYEEGDPFIVQYYTTQTTTTALSFIVEGFFYELPGFFYSGYTPVMATNLEYLEQTNLTNQVLYGYPHFFVEMVDQPSMNASALATDLMNRYPSNISFADTQENELAYVSNAISVIPNVSVMSLTNILDVEYAFIVIMATTGVAIIIYRSASDRRREIAELRAKGMGRSDLLALEGGEGTTLVILGCFLGCVGFLVAFSLNLQIAQNLSLWYTIPRPFTVPLSLAGQIGITLGILIAVVWIICWREVKHTNIPEIAEVLRIY